MGISQNQATEQPTDRIQSKSFKPDSHKQNQTGRLEPTGIDTSKPEPNQRTTIYATATPKFRSEQELSETHHQGDSGGGNKP
jgi:hypothetical protein